MAYENGNEEGRGNIVQVTAPFDGAAAARRLGPFSDDLVKVSNPSATENLYYCTGDATVDCTGIGDADGWVSPRADWPVRLMGKYISVKSAASNYTVTVGQVR